MSQAQLPRRVAVVGVAGSGKTTLAAELAARIRAPHVELDALNWQRGWQSAELAEFWRRVDAATAAPAWVTDGNYSEVRELVWGRAEMLVWLDYPLALIQWRLLRRSLRRIITREELWNGNREDVRGMFFSRDSLFLYAFQSHPRLRRTIPLAIPEYPHLAVQRLTHPCETQRWLDTFAIKDV
jgi:DNA helicase HerA-like ATPase